MALTQKQEKFLEAYILKNGNISEACKAIGIARATHYNWLNNQVDELDNLDTFPSENEYKQAFSDAEEALYDLVESKLMELINDGHPASTMFYCETKLKHRGYTKKTENEHSGTASLNVIITRRIIG